MILTYLKQCKQINQFCTQNGWIDNDSISFEIKEEDSSEMMINVTFNEIIMEGAGCIAGNIACFGQLKLKIENHQIVEVVVI